MLTGGVLAVLAELTNVPRSSDGPGESDPAMASAEGLLVGKNNNALRTLRWQRDSKYVI